ncbi:hypothetical protein MASR2M70_05850 [Bacillota bacterium]
MERIIFRIKILGLCCFVVMASVVLLAYACLGGYSGVSRLCPIVIFVIAINLSMVIFLSHMIGYQYKMLCRGRIIKENHLLYAPAAKSSDENSIDIYFSPFGVLLADRVIAFDAGKDRLKSVDLAGGVATIKYGRLDSEKTLKIPGFEIQNINLSDITNRLKYESGVTLNLIS